MRSGGKPKGQGLRRPVKGKPRRPVKVKVEPKEQVLAKKSFHLLKTIRKEIRKSKEFEVRKILRRIKQTKQQQQQQQQHDGGNKEHPAGQLGKLEAQLALAKAADVERLAVQAARSCGLHLPGQLGRGGAAQQEAEPSSEQSAEAATASPAAGAAAAAGGCASGAQWGDAAAQLAAVVEARILGAKALRERLAEVQAGIEKVAQAAARREAAAAARAAGEPGSAGPQTEAAGSEPAAEQPAPAGAAHKQSGRKRKEQQEDELLVDGGQARAVEEGEPVGPGSSDEGEGEDGEAARERRRQRRERERPAEEDLDDVATCALTKLLGTRGNPGSAAAGGRDEVESESEEDSGVWHSGSDDEQLLRGSDGEQGAAAAWRGRADSGVDGGSGEETGGSNAEAGGGSSSEGEEDRPAPLAAQAAAAAGQQRSRQTAGTAVQELASGGRQQDVPHPQQQGKRQKAKQAVEGKQGKLGKLPQPKKVQKPKNRLGQRARRLLAAQQYGQNARHLQLEREQQVEQQGAAALQPHQKQQQGSGAGGSAEALHPSWAAKQAQKQKLAISISAGPSAAKKVVFDDDGEAKRTGSSSGGQPANASRHPPAAGGSSSGLGASRKPHASGDGSRGTAAGKPAARPRRAEQPLHPSWEAKKRLQEQQKRMILPAQGKKIVFGEDD